MNRKVMLVVPPSVNQRLGFVSYQQPINLAYLASALIREGNEVRILDYEMDKFREPVFLDILRNFAPEIVGFHCKTFNIMQGHALATKVKKYFPEIITIVGGPHSSALPRETMQEFLAFDIVAIGEGEKTISEVCERLSKQKAFDKIDGIAFRKDGQIVLTGPRALVENLDSLPYPARHLLNRNIRSRFHATRGISYLNHNPTEIFTSRGCPGRCIFCAVNVSYGNKIRFRSVPNVLGEVEECFGRFNYNHIIFQDDNFTLNKKRVYKLLEGFRKIGLKSWSCDSRVNTVDKHILEEMASSGCKKISFGVESGSQNILNLIKKDITVEEVRNVVRYAKEAGIRLVECTFMIGSHPDETLEDVQSTWKLMRETSPDILSVSAIVPYPGTEVYRLMKDSGYLKEFTWADFQIIGSRLKWRTKNFSSDELSKLQNWLLTRYYFSFSYFKRSLSKIRSFGDLWYWIRIGIDYLSFVGSKRM